MLCLYPKLFRLNICIAELIGRCAQRSEPYYEDNAFKREHGSILGDPCNGNEFIRRKEEYFVKPCHNERIDDKIANDNNGKAREYNTPCGYLLPI